MKMYSTAIMETAETCRNSKLTIYFLRKNTYHGPFFLGEGLYSEKPIIVHCFAQQVFASFIIVIINSIIIIIHSYPPSSFIIHISGVAILIHHPLQPGLLLLPPAEGLARRGNCEGCAAGCGF
jgi:hypothetical protein